MTHELALLLGGVLQTWWLICSFLTVSHLLVRAQWISMSNTCNSGILLIVMEGEDCT